MEESVRKDIPLLGRIVAVMAQTGRRRWWVEIIEVHDSGRFVKVKTNGKMFGRPRWVGLEQVMFR